MDSEPINFVLVGVGGQGTILASDVLAELGLKLGRDVKKAEVHGMSQRGGSVVSHLRWGQAVFSPIIPRGEADVLIAFEKLEAARYIHWLRPGGIVLVNQAKIMPALTTSSAVYPDEPALRAILAHYSDHVNWVNGTEIAERLGNSQTANVVMLGALSVLLDCELSTWMEVLRLRIPPKYMELNRQAFEAGRAAMAEPICPTKVP